MVAGSLIAVAAVYGWGLARLWRNAGYGNGIRPREAAAFAAGWIAMAVALSPPLDEWSETWLAAHMIQHELLMVVAAPLVASSAPLIALLWSMPRSGRRRALAAVRRPAIAAAWSFLLAPATVWLLHAMALWVWHLPALYGYALEHEAAHALQHLCFFGTAAMFWWGIVHGRYGRSGLGAAVVYVFATGVHGGVLGALLTFSTQIWYPAYLRPHPGGLTPLEDQQLAGLLMWVPAGLIFAGGGLVLFAAWLRESDRRTRFKAIASTIALAAALAGSGCDHLDMKAKAAASPNPYAGDRAAMVEGRRVFIRFNCAGCHGDHAGGGMGPSLRDADWIHGSGEQQLFYVIAEGRAHGMPSWASRLTSEQVWQLVTYIKSLRTLNEPQAPDQ